MNNLMMHDPDLLKLMIDMYFEERLLQELPPTVPGLALAMGFNSVRDIVKTLEHFENETDPNKQRYDERSVNYIIQSLTKIEDYHLTNGMIERIPAALVKFTLGAYHGVKEPSSSNNGNHGNNIIQIAFEAPPQSITMRDAVDASTSPRDISDIRSAKLLEDLQGRNSFEVKING